VEGSDLSKIYDLDRKMGVLPILIYLHDHGPTPKTTISRFMVYRHETIDRALNLLARFDVVASETDTWFPYRQTFDLTLFGRQLVASPIHEWPLLLAQTQQAAVAASKMAGKPRS